MVRCPQCGARFIQGTCPTHGSAATDAFWVGEPEAPAEQTKETAAAQATTLAVGARLDRYTVQGVLGLGGEGVVYACHDAEGTRWAVKVLAGADAAEGLEREAALSSRVRHPHVLCPTRTGQLPSGAAYLVMPLVDGRPLSALLRLGPLAWRSFAPLLGQALSALAAIHAAGLVHRDLKPDNLMVHPGERALTLIDFGTARAGRGPLPPTTPNLVRGTLEYMSPEQLQGRPVDLRTDLFSLGCVAWEALTGALPWPGNAVASARSRVVREADPSPIAAASARHGEALAALVRRDPGERPDSAAAAAATLGLAL